MTYEESEYAGYDGKKMFMRIWKPEGPPKAVVLGIHGLGALLFQHEGRHQGEGHEEGDEEEVEVGQRGLYVRVWDDVIVANIKANGMAEEFGELLAVQVFALCCLAA